MDGVIIDSEPIHKACEKTIFRLLKISLTEEEHNAFVGTTDETMWISLVESFNLPVNVDEIIQLKKSLYFESLKRNENIQPICYIPKLIAGLHKKGFSLALASSAPREQIDYILDTFNLKLYFQSIISGEDVKYGKPNPEIFIKAAEAVGIKPGKCIVIEDSLNGIIAAKKADMKCIGYYNPHSGNQNLSQADMIITSFDQISVKSIRKLISVS
jgi:HAD superfamily hydrolase (TIGR01509 family)